MEPEVRRESLKHTCHKVWPGASMVGPTLQALEKCLLDTFLPTAFAWEETERRSVRSVGEEVTVI